MPQSCSDSSDDEQAAVAMQEDAAADLRVEQPTMPLGVKALTPPASKTLADVCWQMLRTPDLGDLEQKAWALQPVQQMIARGEPIEQSCPRRIACPLDMAVIVGDTYLARYLLK
ncbi:MAG: hypothetical protein EOO40_11310, partial [Deltaproteobacteria bacterium]